MQQAMASAASSARAGTLGPLGRPLDRRSPFFIGMAAAAGVAVTAGVVELIIAARSVLILIGLGLFIAAGMDPVVSWLARYRIPRWAGVLIVVVCTIAAIGGFFAKAVPPLASEVGALVQHLPQYERSLQSHSSELGRLNARFHLVSHLKSLLTSHGTALAAGVLGAGRVVLSAVTSIFVVAVLSVYFLADMPRIKRFGYRLVPNSRRPRAILIGDEIIAKVGGYVLGNVITSLIAGLGTYLWMIALGIPYAILLAIAVFLLDLIPVIGSSVGGAIVTLVALTVSLPVALATLGFYIAYRLAEDYLIVPKIIGRAVQVPAVVTVIALLIGGALLGIIGALVAIPVAAAVRLLLREISFRRLDQS